MVALADVHLLVFLHGLGQTPQTWQDQVDRPARRLQGRGAVAARAPPRPGPGVQRRGRRRRRARPAEPTRRRADVGLVRRQPGRDGGPGRRHPRTRDRLAPRAGRRPGQPAPLGDAHAAAGVLDGAGQAAGVHGRGEEAVPAGRCSTTTAAPRLPRPPRRGHRAGARSATARGQRGRRRPPRPSPRPRSRRRGSRGRPGRRADVHVDTPAPRPFNALLYGFLAATTERCRCWTSPATKVRRSPRGERPRPGVPSASTTTARPAHGDAHPRRRRTRRRPPASTPDGLVAHSARTHHHGRPDPQRRGRRTRLAAVPARVPPVSGGQHRGDQRRWPWRPSPPGAPRWPWGRAAARRAGRR